MPVNKEVDNKLLMDFLRKNSSEALKSGEFLIEKFYPRLLLTPDNELTVEELYEIINICQKICCFSNEVILDYLIRIRISKNTLQWFVKAEEIMKELERIEKNGIIKFSKVSFFAAILFHLQNKVAINVIEDLGLVERYNNKNDFNFLRKIYSQYFRRRRHAEKATNAIVKSKEDLKMDFLMSNIAIDVPDAGGQEKFLRDLSRGDTFYFLQKLNEFEIISGTKSDAYLAMFDLISLIVKDKELLKEEDYLGDARYRNYETYKINRVKRILTQT